MGREAVLEHRASAFGRKLQRGRLRLALGIAAVEGVLVLAGALAWWAVVLFAIAAVVAYRAVGRDHPRPDVRNATWVAAVSQLLVVLVPVVAAVTIALAAVVVVMLAIGVLVVLLVERR